MGTKYTRIVHELRTGRLDSSDGPGYMGEWEQSPGSAKSLEERLAVFEGIPGLEIELDKPHELSPDETGHAYLTLGGVRMELRERLVFDGLHDGIRKLRDELIEQARLAPAGSWRAETLDEVADMVCELIAEENAEILRGLPEGHCVHGVYVGGCGIDWMCGACEDGHD